MGGDWLARAPAGENGRMDTIKQIGGMLRAEDPHKRIAAAVVLGELKVKDAGIVQALSKMAQDPFDAYAHAALGALGGIGSMKALPALLQALGRGGETQKLAARALAALGEEALPEIKARLSDASPEVRAAVSQALPSMGGKASFQLTLEGMRGQPWDAVNKVALSVRQEVRGASEAERRALKTQIEKFLALKKTQEDEPALRGALKVLGYLELPESADTLMGYLGKDVASMVRIEAATALRFVLSKKVTPRGLKKLGELLDDLDPLVRRASRDSLMTLKYGPEVSGELAKLAVHPVAEVAHWAIGVLGGMGGEVAEKTLLPIACGSDRARAQAAAAAVAALEGGERLLCTGLCKAKEEIGAQVLAEALTPHVRKLSKKDVNRLFGAGVADLGDALALARRKLEPIRELRREEWAQALRERARACLKKDPVRAATLLQMLCRSPLATPEDRYAFARMELARSPLDPHPRARTRDPALPAFERLVEDGFPLGRTVAKDKAIGDEALYFLGFHFIESTVPEFRNVGAELLECLVGRSGRTKLGKAAKNKLALAGARA